MSLPLYLGCHFISKLSPLPEGSAQNAIVCIPPQLLHILPLQNKCIRKPIYFLLRNSNVTDPRGIKLKKFSMCAFGQHMQGRDEQGQRNKAEEEEDGSEFIFLAFTASSCKHHEHDPKPVGISVCPCSTGSVKESVSPFVFPGHPSCGAQFMCRMPLPQWGQISSTLRKKLQRSCFPEF